MTYVLIGMGVVVVLVVAFFISSYNKCIVVKNRVKNQWSQIDVQTKRRYDLIPNLVETVKGCAAFESKTLEAVTAARTAAMKSSSAAEIATANDKLTGVLHSLWAVSESYPELKASENFRELQKQLAETEDKIAKARQFYNDTVLRYNNTIGEFPRNLVAGIFGFRENEYLSTPESEKEAVKVNF